MRAREQPSRPENLAGSLLLAHPAMRDPNFRRAVVLMSAHNDQGAMGVVLNRPLDKDLGALNGAFALGPLAGVPVFQGGPVQTEQLILVAWQPQPDGIRFFFGIEPDKATQRAAFNGVCCAIVQAARRGGDITIEASSPGLASALVAVSAKVVPLRPAVA